MKISQKWSRTRTIKGALQKTGVCGVQWIWLHRGSKDFIIIRHQSHVDKFDFRTLQLWLWEDAVHRMFNIFKWNFEGLWKKVWIRCIQIFRLTWFKMTEKSMLKENVLNFPFFGKNHIVPISQNGNAQNRLFQRKIDALRSPLSPCTVKFTGRHKPLFSAMPP